MTHAPEGMRSLLAWQIAQEEELRQLGREERLERLRVELQQLDDDLKSLGLVTGEFFNAVTSEKQPEGYRTAIPVLLASLKKPMTDRAKAGIAHMLCEKIPEIRACWPEIVGLYDAQPAYYDVLRDGKNVRQELDAKDRLANLLIAAFTPNRLPELFDLLRNRSHGGSRSILLHVLRRRKGLIVDEFLLEMSHDCDLVTELASWKRLDVRPRIN